MPLSQQAPGQPRPGRFCAIAVAYCAPYAVFDCFSAFRGLLVTQTGGANTYPNLYRHSLSGGLVFEIALTLPGDKNAFSGAHFSTYTGILILAKIPHSVVCSIEAPVTWGNTPTFIHG